MAELNLREHLRLTTETAYKKLVNDLNALDESQASGSPSPAVRPAVKIVAECGSVNAALANVVATGEFSRPTPEERAALYASVTTRAEALSVLEAGTQTMYAAIDGTSPERWGDTVAGPFGPWTRLAAAGYAALHMAYHDGQLNYVHLLHGDAEMHWK
jgi:hypothetical protein